MKCDSGVTEYIPRLMYALEMGRLSMQLSCYDQRQQCSSELQWLDFSGNIAITRCSELLFFDSDAF